MELDNKKYAMNKVTKYLTKLRGDINVQQKYIYSKKLDHWVNVMIGGDDLHFQKYTFLFVNNYEFRRCVNRAFGPLRTLYNNNLDFESYMGEIDNKPPLKPIIYGPGDSNSINLTHQYRNDILEGKYADYPYRSDIIHKYITRENPNKMIIEVSRH